MQIVHIQSMQRDHLDYQLRRQTIRFYHFALQHGNNSQYLKFMHKILCDQTQAQVTFDARFADAIKYSINLMLCITFEEQQKKFVDLSIFVKLAEQLQAKGLIGKRHVFEIKNFKVYSIVNKINEYISLMSVGKFTNEEMKQQWQLVFGLSIGQFWKAVMKKQVKNSVLITLYGHVKEVPDISKTTQIREYVQCLIKAQKQSYQNDKYAKCIKQQELNSTKDQSPDDELQITYDQKYHQMQLIQVRLQEIAYFYSMFFNPAHQNNLKSINQLINLIQNNIFVNQGYRLQLFGSLKSTFALSNWYDIDFNFVSLKQKQISRQQSIAALKQIQNQFRNQVITWFKKSKVQQFQTIPQPYLKIEVNPFQFRRCFGIENVTKIDFTVGNRTAVINSVILSHYSRIPLIHFFCILVKVWAKSRHVTNRFKPYDGLSSYVVILMCLYYLMQTGQIDFIEISEEQLKYIEVGSFKPNLKKVQMKGLYQNFKGFLQFYAETGPFQKERKVVCLLKGEIPKQLIWNQDFIINVYDFIDRTNPGRLKMEHRSFLFYQFRRALLLLKEKTIPKINQIFQNA